MSLFRKRRPAYRPSSETVRDHEIEQRNNRNIARYFMRSRERFERITGRKTAEIMATAVTP